MRFENIMNEVTTLRGTRDYNEQWQALSHYA